MSDDSTRGADGFRLKNIWIWPTIRFPENQKKTRAHILEAICGNSHFKCCWEVNAIKDQYNFVVVSSPVMEINEGYRASIWGY